MNVTEFDLKVLRWIEKGVYFLGAKRVHYAVAARRLEKKGLANKGERWYITEAGRKLLSEKETGG
jgi:hypothetical protein